MSEENKIVPRKNKTKFKYNPEAVEVATLNHLVFDHLHFKLLCKVASDLSITPNYLIAMIFEKFLININYLDPKAPACDPVKPAVTLMDIREDPNKLFNWTTNPLIAKNKEILTEFEKPFKFSDLEDEDWLGYK